MSNDTGAISALAVFLLLRIVLFVVRPIEFDRLPSDGGFSNISASTLRRAVNEDDLRDNAARAAGAGAGDLDVGDVAARAA